MTIIFFHSSKMKTKWLIMIRFAKSFQSLNQMIWRTYRSDGWREHNFSEYWPPRCCYDARLIYLKKQEYSPNSKCIQKIKFNRNKYKGYSSQKCPIKQRCFCSYVSLWGCLLTNDEKFRRISITFGRNEAN